MGQEPEVTTPQEGQEPAPATEPKEEAKTPTFDADYVKQLRSEAAASRKARQELEAKLNEYEERDKSEVEKLTSKLAKAEQAKAEADARLLRFEVAQTKEVPAEAVDLLSGTTREELEASADKILNLVKSRTDNENEPNFDGGAREPAPENKSPEDAHNESVLALLGLKQN
jgi:hypothetical protein